MCIEKRWKKAHQNAVLVPLGRETTEVFFIASLPPLLNCIFPMPPPAKCLTMKVLLFE